MSRTFALETLGCKVNQYESSYLIEVLRDAGYEQVSFRDRADVYVVHSCAVTSKAGFQTRQLLRRAARANPQARIAAIGCDAQIETERLADERLATHILGTEEKYNLLHWLETPGSLSAPFCAAGDSRLLNECRLLPVNGMLSGRARAVLKVQDGCDAFCSYCIVPYTRGRSRSLPAAEVRAQMDRLLASGYREIVLTGIHLGQWGRDLNPPMSLAQLLQLLGQRSLPARMRLSSLESVEWSAELLETIRMLPGVCPHFHIPLQSGDGEILERMHRPYTPGQYAEVIHALSRLFPQAALGADIMVGFPGETERHFQNTYELVRDLPLTYFHVFPFSPRPGTPAAEWPGCVAGAEMKRRALLLRELSAGKKRLFQERFLGEWLDVLVEGEERRNLWKGTSDNYLQVHFTANRPLLSGAVVRVRPCRMEPTALLGEMDAG
jgi:threonylcarbamoyladenosine tRNA methylthiotransferase MtaB